MEDNQIQWLRRRPPASWRGLVGPKALGLCTLRRLGMRVPPCFFVTTLAFRRHLDARGIRSQTHRPLDGLEEIRKAILESPLEGVLRDQVAAAYGRLGAAVVAVRSSATAEDLPGHSFAGQYETILGVASLDECLCAIKRCWASVWTRRAFEYRLRNGIDHEQVEMAVVVQQQIEPDAAGVVFSLDPVTGSRSRIVIEVCAGLGDALVSGRVQPDRFVLRKRDLSLIRRNLVAGGPSVALKSARRLARQVRHIERRLGSPQDVEWGIRDGTPWFLQARPITAIPPERPCEDRQVWTNLNLGEVAPDVMTPVTWSMIEIMLVSMMKGIARLLGADLGTHPLAGLVAGRLYWNINTGIAAARPLVPASELDRANSLFGGDQARMYAIGQFDITEEDLPDLGFSWPRYVLSWPRIVYDLWTHSPRRGDKARARVKVRNDVLLGLDLEAMDTAALARTSWDSLQRTIGDLDLLYLATSAPTIRVFEKACRDWLGDPDLSLGYRLLAAQGGMADTEAGLDLWRIADLVHADRETEAAILSDLDWQAVRERLCGTHGGRQFLAAWDRFMTEHGHHSRGEMEFCNARWSERPDYVLGWLRSSLRSMGAVDPLARHRRLAIEREALTRQCLQRLRSPIKRSLFSWCLRGARKVAVDRENWKNEFVRLVAALRRVLLCLGARFQKDGLVCRADDVFFLEMPEIEAVAQGRSDPELGQRISGRRAEYERNRACAPPPVVVGRFDPDRCTDLQVDAEAHELKGIAVSPGVVSGKARVILRTDDRQHLEAGEILVAPFTDPAWTPYFLPAAGVVMDQGGVLSHGAIIAREYGIPAVVNVGPASRIIRTGQRLRVDGDRGVVTILPADPRP